MTVHLWEMFLTAAIWFVSLRVYANMHVNKCVRLALDAVRISSHLDRNKGKTTDELVNLYLDRMGL